MGNHRQVKAETNKASLTFTQHSMDAPLLPVADMERLHQFRPDLVDFVIDQAKAEAEARREQAKTINRSIFIERMAGQVFALFIAILGVGGGIYAGVHGHDWLGGTIATVTIGTLAVAYLRNGKKPE